VLWIDPLYPDAVTRAAQPALVNGDFSAWTGVDPNATPDGWLKCPDPGVSANHIEQAAGGCRLVSDGGLTYVRQIPLNIVGNRYKETLIISLLSWGYLASLNEPIVYSTEGVHVNEYTTASTGLGFKRHSGAVDGTFRVDSFENLSLVSIAPRVGSGTIAQATATAQAWVDSSTSWTCYDGVADFQTSSLAAAAWEYLSDGSAWSVIAEVNADADADQTIVSNMSANTHHGFALSLTAAGAVRIRLGNATGAYALDASSAAAVVASGVDAIVTASYAGVGSNVHVYVDDVLVLSVAPGTLSAGAPPVALTFGRLGAGAEFFGGSMRNIAFFPTAMSDLHRAKSLAYLRGLST